MTKKDNSKSEKQQGSKSKYKKILRNCILGILIIGILGAVVSSGYAFAIIKNTPPLDVQSVLNLSEPSQLFDSEGNLIDRLPTEEIRYKIDSKDIPQNLKDAYVAIEDERFYQHNGIDIKRIMGAIYRDAIFLVTGRGGLQGASTLTQQLIKNTLLTNEIKIERKIKEIYLSLQLEKQLSKDQILTAYLNTIPLGGLIYGVQAASLYYFDKPAIELNLAESAFIAGLTQAPTSYSPYNPANGEGNQNPSYINRTLMVLNKMKELGFITEDEYTPAVEFAKTNQFNFKQAKISNKLNDESFLYAAVDQVKKDLKEEYKYTNDEISKLMVNGGLKIYTTMDKKIQESTQSILDNRNNIQIDLGKGDPEKDGTPLLQASAVILDYRNGDVKALVGGRGNQPARSSNRAYDSFRSIASTTKPLTVYGPAIDTKMYTAATPIDDSGMPSDVKNKFPNWNLKNWDNTFSGFVNIRECIARSKNIPTVEVANKIGVDTAVSYGEKLGLVYKEDSKGLSTVALGEFTGGDGGNTYRLASAYGTFGNNGVRIEPKLYTKVVDATGKVILEKKSKEIKVFSPQTAYIMQDILKSSATNANFSNMPVIGKTGTSEGTKDFWFAGLTPYYSGAVWVGYDIPTTMTGYSTAMEKLWAKIMAPVHEGLGYKEISQQPSEIVKVTVCKDSGKRATSLCSKDQRGSRVSTEYFIDGTEPSGVCDVHVTARVNKTNNKLATANTPSSLIVERVFIRKPNANPNAADYKYIVPTQSDDSKPIFEAKPQNNTANPPSTPPGTENPMPPTNPGENPETTPPITPVNPPPVNPDSGGQRRSNDKQR